jgi:hypothetical protein
MSIYQAVYTNGYLYFANKRILYSRFLWLNEKYIHRFSEIIRFLKRIYTFLLEMPSLLNWWVGDPQYTAGKARVVYPWARTTSAGLRHRRPCRNASSAQIRCRMPRAMHRRPALRIIDSGEFELATDFRWSAALKASAFGSLVLSNRGQNVRFSIESCSLFPCCEK